MKVTLTPRSLVSRIGESFHKKLRKSKAIVRKQFSVESSVHMLPVNHVNGTDCGVRVNITVTEDSWFHRQKDGSNGGTWVPKPPNGPRVSTTNTPIHRQSVHMTASLNWTVHAR
jgi:hypothetical protein